MNHDPKYTLPFELGLDRALNIYGKRFIRILIWGAFGIGGIVLTLLFAVVLEQAAFGIPFLPLFIVSFIFLLTSNASSSKLKNSKKSKKENVKEKIGRESR